MGNNKVILMYNPLQMHRHLFKRGFTLAEVLITLSIIGVISALMIPSFVKNMSNISNYQAMKVNYRNLSSASQLIINDNGGSISHGDLANSYDLLTRYGKYLTFVKICQTKPVTNGCFNNPGTYAFDTGNLIALTWDDAAESAAVLKNGSILFVYSPVSDGNLPCTSTGACARLYIDVNGLKGPNTLGKDIFNANLYSNRLGVGGQYGGQQNMTSYGGQGWGMTGYCLINKCPQ
jgi:prepilin-type N-terminal cleavage/methylation domain-containing protein